MGISNSSKSRLLRSLLIFVFFVAIILIYGSYSTSKISPPEVSIPQNRNGEAWGQEEWQVEQLSPSEELNNRVEFGLSSKEDIKAFDQHTTFKNRSMTTTVEDYLLEEQLHQNTTQVAHSGLGFFYNRRIEAGKLYVSGHLNGEINLERICPHNGSGIILLILITSALEHAEARMSIRQTWGHYGTRRDIGIAFLLGRGTNRTVNRALSIENYLYGDLIRGNFLDSYENLTLKTISALEWTDLLCPQVKYILKTDDDMFINVPKLLKFIAILKERQAKSSIFGCLAVNWRPVRNRKSKYYISRLQFLGNQYPNFTTGPAYLMTGDIVHSLYVRSLQTVFLKLEDVFLTGIVAESLNIDRFHVPQFVNRRIKLNLCNIRRSISLHMIRYIEKFDIWQKLHNQSVQC